MILKLFKYNWQVREEWLKWCEEITHEELVKQRVGGMGNILHTLFHVIHCEELWVNQICEETAIEKNVESIKTLKDVQEYSSTIKNSTFHFLNQHIEEKTERSLIFNLKNGKTKEFSYEKILYHIVTHEIHHIGQLSIWARELGKVPVNSDFLIREC
ncbi:DinB family protein [Rummeliibacillus pycnus]|uniref:DinB family protein n=1 Tax=Rummeliibacillus pycnus TaxID=101070 RepID=UPI000C9C4A95|nr:DinB family protein [Rummeliibacillus pycnus]